MIKYWLERYSAIYSWRSLIKNQQVGIMDNMHFWRHTTVRWPLSFILANQALACSPQTLVKTNHNTDCFPQTREVPPSACDPLKLDQVELQNFNFLEIINIRYFSILFYTRRFSHGEAFDRCWFVYFKQKWAKFCFRGRLIFGSKIRFSSSGSNEWKVFQNFMMNFQQNTFILSTND